MTQQRRRDVARGYWLLTRGLNGGTDAMTLALTPRNVLPVFSFREEAELFLWLGDLAGGWSAQSVSAAELAALLLNNYLYVDDIALDPLPEALPLIGLVTVSRTRFIAVLLGRDPDPLSSITRA